MSLAICLAAFGFVAILAAVVAYAALCVGKRGDPFMDGGQ